MTATLIIIYSTICYLIALTLLSSKTIMKRVPRVKKRVVQSFTLGAKIGCLFAMVVVLWECIFN